MPSSAYEILDRKSTRLNSSHTISSYSVFCLKTPQASPPVPGTRTRRARPLSPGWRGCFFLNDPATTEIYPLSLHDALPIYNLVCRLLLTRLYIRKASGKERVEMCVVDVS